MRVAAEGGDQRWDGARQLLERQAPVLLHQVHEPEVARAEDDDALAADVVLRALLLLRRPVASPRAWPTMESCSSPPATSVTRPSRASELDEVVEAVAVALLEGGALRLAVVGEDDDLVGRGA